MPEESSLTFHHFSAYELEISYDPQRWWRKRPTNIALVFPYDEPAEYLSSLKPVDILLSCSGFSLIAPQRTLMYVALLFKGELVYGEKRWQITNPSYALSIPLPSNSDIYIPLQRAPAHATIAQLIRHLPDDPPASLVCP